MCPEFWGDFIIFELDLVNVDCVYVKICAVVGGHHRDLSWYADVFGSMTRIAAAGSLTYVLAIQCRTKLDFISWMVERIDGWDNPYIVLKTASALLLAAVVSTSRRLAGGSQSGCLREDVLSVLQVRFLGFPNKMVYSGAM